MSSSRGERAAAPARFAAAVTAARDDARARFEKAITSGKRMTRRLRVPRRANPTCVASISSSTGAGGGADPTETPERPSAKALVHAPAEGAGGVRFVSNDDPTPPGPSDEELGVDVREPPAPSPSAIRFTSLGALVFKIAATISAPSRLVRKVKRVLVLQAMRTHVSILRECRLEWGVELADSLGRPVAAHARDPQPVTLAPDLVRMRGVV